MGSHIANPLDATGQVTLKKRDFSPIDLTGDSVMADERRDGTYIFTPRPMFVPTSHHPFHASFSVSLLQHAWRSHHIHALSLNVS